MPPSSVTSVRPTAPVAPPPDVDAVVAPPPPSAPAVDADRFEPRTLDAASVKQADEDWQQLRGMRGGVEGRRLPERVAALLAKHPNDPDYRARLMANVAKDGALPEVASAFFKEGDGRYTSRYTDDTRRELVAGLKDARAAGAVDDQALRHAGTTQTAPVNDLVRQSGVERMQRTPEAEAAARDVAAATADYQAKKQAVEDKNAELARHLAKAGPALDDAQKKKFIDAFREKHKDVYAAEVAAAEKLADTLKKHGPGLEAGAISNQADAKVYGDALEALAGSPRASLALEHLTRIVADGGPLAKALGGDEKLETMMGTAFEHAYTERILKGQDPIAAAKALVGDVEKALGKGKKLSAAATKLRTSIGELSKMLSEPVKNADQVAKLTDKFLKLAAGGPMGKSMAAVGFAQKMYEGVDAGLQGQWAKSLKELSGGSKQGVEVLAGAMGAFARLGRGGAAAVEVAKYATRLVPVLGTITSAAATWDDFRKLKATQNPGYAIAAFGDALSTFGGLMSTTVVLAPAGEVFAAVGTAVSIAGGFVADRIQDHRDEQAVGDLLVTAGLDEKTARFVAGHPRGVGTLAEAGLSREQILELTRSPNADQIFGAPGLLQGAVDKLKAYGATPQQLQRVLEQTTDMTQLDRLVRVISSAEQKPLGPLRPPISEADVAARQAQRTKHVREAIARLMPEVARVLDGAQSR